MSGIWDVLNVASQSDEGGKEVKLGFARGDAASDSRHSKKHHHPHLARLNPMKSSKKEKEEKIKDDENWTASSPNMTDKLMDRLVATALPTAVSKKLLDQRIQRQKGRPPFSVQVTSRAFRKFGARTSGVYEAYYLTAELITWKRPTMTLSVLSIYSIICLHPYLLLSLPFILFLGVVMVPAYMARHPPEPHPLLETYLVPAKGPALKEPAIPKPVPEVSREFFLNVVDTQNFMIDYVLVFDFITENLAQFGLFAGDELRSTMLYMIILGVSVLLMIFGRILFSVIPWSLMFLGSGWLTLLMTYPMAVATSQERKFESDGPMQKFKKDIRQAYEQALWGIDRIAESEMEVVEQPEIRHIETFELQSFNVEAGQWSASIFSKDPYPHDVCRKSDPDYIPVGVSTIVGVQFPDEWEGTTEWQLDYQPDGWVIDRSLQALSQVDIGEKWVYDAIDGQRLMLWRRRRWLRECVRKSYIESDDEKSL